MKKLVLLACASLPLSAFAQGRLSDKPYIYVEGKAEIEKPAENNEETGRKRGKLIGYSVTRTFAAKVRDVRGYLDTINCLPRHTRQTDQLKGSEFFRNIDSHPSPSARVSTSST
jgi:hypothetical protein